MLTPLMDLTIFTVRPLHPYCSPYSPSTSYVSVVQPTKKHPSLKVVNALGFGKFEKISGQSWTFYPEGKPATPHLNEVPHLEKALKTSWVESQLERGRSAFLKRLKYRTFGNTEELEKGAI